MLLPIPICGPNVCIFILVQTGYPIDIEIIPFQCFIIGPILVNYHYFILGANPNIVFLIRKSGDTLFIYLADTVWL